MTTLAPSSSVETKSLKIEDLLPIIADIAGIAPEDGLPEINGDSNLVTDLGFTRGDFAQLLFKIRHDFGIDLDWKEFTLDMTAGMKVRQILFACEQGNVDERYTGLQFSTKAERTAALPTVLREPTGPLTNSKAGTVRRLFAVLEKNSLGQ